ncbi:hypothetical protein [Citrobacter sp. Marseille-Q6884]|uniref:hypothetical protein n=1 Tax=Citrobacter sp. Marseille-Q6884 TaxID=2956786 RepID=UPI0021B47D34|nr:hypothetical protein [Citrobacter sp. Marseille-Q6884]EMF0717968.1 hypothetical protein [Citrobacter freundii]
MSALFKKFAFQIIPVQIFIFIFWFKNGFIDKVMGVLLGIITPDTAYAGDTWAGWKGYIVGTWDKSQVAHYFLSPVFDYVFPVLIILQCLPFVLIIISVLKGEFLANKERPWLIYAAFASLFVAGCMVFTQTLSGASDGQYLWQFIGFSMVAIMFIRNEQKR